MTFAIFNKLLTLQLLSFLKNKINNDGFKYNEKNLMSPTKGQKMTPEVTKFASDEKRADRKSSNSPHGKVLKQVKSHRFY